MAGSHLEKSTQPFFAPTSPPARATIGLRHAKTKPSTLATSKLDEQPMALQSFPGAILGCFLLPLVVYWLNGLIENGGLMVQWFYSENPLVGKKLCSPNIPWPHAPTDSFSQPPGAREPGNQGTNAVTRSHLCPTFGQFQVTDPDALPRKTPSNLGKFFNLLQTYGPCYPKSGEKLWFFKR